jgi:hypothetical protein
MPLSLTDVWDLRRSYADRAGKTSIKADFGVHPGASWRLRCDQKSVGINFFCIPAMPPWNDIADTVVGLAAFFIFPAPNRRFFCLATDELIERRPIGIIADV